MMRQLVCLCGYMQIARHRERACTSFLVGLIARVPAGLRVTSKITLVYPEA